MLSKRKSVGDYTIGKTIGQGAFSKVKIAYNKITKEEVAIKIINKKQLEVKNKKTQENKELYKKRREHEELKKKKAIENAVHRHSAPKIENSPNDGRNYNNKDEVQGRYCEIIAHKPEEKADNKTNNNESNNTTNTNNTQTNNSNNTDAISNSAVKSGPNSNNTSCSEEQSVGSTISSTLEPLEIRKHGHNPSVILEEEESQEFLNANDNFSPKKSKEKFEGKAIPNENNDKFKVSTLNSNANDEANKANEANEVSEANEANESNEKPPEVIISPDDKEEKEYEQKLEETEKYNPVSHANDRKFSMDSSNLNSNHPNSSFISSDRKFSLDSNVKNHTVNDTKDVCTPLQNIDNNSSSCDNSTRYDNSISCDNTSIDSKDNSIFLKDHSLIPLPSYYERLQNEVQLMMRLDHPNIIKIYQVIESEDETLIVMEYAPGGELIDYILTKKHLNETEARKFFRQIISAIDHCHMANVVHRDLKLENLLLSKDKNILITDFGLGRTFDGATKDYMTTFCGTPNYAAVELISGIPYIGVKSDIWALGVILYVMMTGKPPFDGKSINALYRRIKRIDYKVPSYFSKDLANLLAKIFVRDPEQRASINDLRDDPWVNYEEIEKPIRIFPINAQEMEQIVSGITNGNGYVSYIFREPTSSNKKKESNLNLSIALSQSNINDCQLISNERRKSNVVDEIIKRRLNNTKSPLSPDNTKSPFRNMVGCEIPNMDIWGGVLVDSSFSQKIRNKMYSSVMETGGSGLCGGMKNEDNYHSVSDISRSSSHNAANRHCLRLNTNVSNSPCLINSAGVDDRSCINPRYYSIVNISERNGGSCNNSDESINSACDSGKVDGVTPLKSYSKSVSQINDEKLYNTKMNNKTGVGKLKSDSKNKQLQRSNSYGISSILGKKKNNINNIEVVPGIEGNTANSTISPLNPRHSLDNGNHKRASSAFSISVVTKPHNHSSNLSNSVSPSTPSPLKRESKRVSKSVNISPVSTKTGSPTEEYSDVFESFSEMNSPEDSLPNYQEIEMWHLIHKPSKTVRSTRLNFNKSTATTKPPFSLFQNLCWALYEMRNVYPNRFYFVRNPDYYLFECNLLNENLNDVEVKFEVEVCKVWLLKLYALRLKRISGDPFLYEELYSELISLMKADEEVNNDNSPKDGKIPIIEEVK